MGAASREDTLSSPDRELPLQEVPHTLYRLVDGSGEPVCERAEVGGEEALVGALFASAELAREFSGSAAEFGMPALAGLEAGEAPPDYPLAEADLALVVTSQGTGLFHVSDVAARLAGTARLPEFGFPLYVLADERGESPLISVEDEGGELMVAALFSSPQSAERFRESAPHLELPESVGSIDDADGLRRHALVARNSGAQYVVIDPEAGETDAIPVDELAGAEPSGGL